MMDAQLREFLSLTTPPPTPAVRTITDAGAIKTEFTKLHPSSPVRKIAELPPDVRAELLASMSDSELEALCYDTYSWCRIDQRLPYEPDHPNYKPKWNTWLIKSGRGWGKTFTGANAVKYWTDNAKPGEMIRIAIVGRTAADVRDVMLFGDSGLMSLYPQNDRPRYVRNDRAVYFKNGCKALLYSAEEPDGLRGPQQHYAWVDELPAFKYPKEAWDNLKMGLRLGKNPQAVVTTTPRGTPLIRKLVNDPTVTVTSGSTYDNAANLSESFLDEMRIQYEGTTLGAQELHGQVLDDSDAALWSSEDFRYTSVLPPFRKVLVSVDPSSREDGRRDMCGIVALGLTYDNTVVVIADRTNNYSVLGWGAEAVKLAHAVQAPLIVAENNQGGGMVRSNLQLAASVERLSCPPVLLYASTSDKRTRATPVVGLYQQKRVFHFGTMPRLEDEMVTWRARDGEKSPNRIDALTGGIAVLLPSILKEAKRAAGSTSAIARGTVLTKREPSRFSY